MPQGQNNTVSLKELFKVSPSVKALKAENAREFSQKIDSLPLKQQQELQQLLESEQAFMADLETRKKARIAKTVAKFQIKIEDKKHKFSRDLRQTQEEFSKPAEEEKEKHLIEEIEHLPENSTNPQT